MTRNLSVLSRVSSLAIAVVLTAGAAAQSFQGTPTVSSGDVIISEGIGTTDVTLNSVQSVIDWVPDDNAVGNFGAIAFQNSGTTATFSSTSDFAVLNRINVADPSRMVGLNGTLNSLVGGSTGGSIYFYSPSGFVIGSSAVINVGSLVLSASPIAVDGSGNFINGTSVTFNQAPNSNAAINTVAGSQINAFGSGSYVALVAPQITHQGTIRTDTAAALVAAESATINFSPDGLFDIQVTVGTDAATGIDIDGGTIARRDPTEALGNNHYAYLVAVAKNDAVSMLIRNGGSVGFDTATSAALEDNVVVLSGGRNIDTGQTDVAVGVAPVNLTIDSSTFTTDVYAEISGSADIRTSTGNTSFGLDPTSTSLELHAGDDSAISATNGNVLTITGDLFANLDVAGTGAITTGNLLRLQTVSNSTLTVGGDVNVLARTFGASDGETDGGDAVGGTVIVQTSSGGTINIAGDLGINVDAEGGDVAGFGLTAGNGTGGTVHVLANGGSGAILTVGGDVNVSATGYGGSVGGDCQADCGVAGGNGTGGTVLLQAMTGSGNQLNLNGTVDLIATGEGGSGDISAGSGTGGNIQLVSADAGVITIDDDLTADASGHGGFGMESSEGGGQGGSATGGFVGFSFDGAASTIDLNGLDNVLGADAFGGDGMRGGNATGGWVDLQVDSNGTLTAPFIDASADASGGSASIFFEFGTNGGSATGGRAWLQGSGGGSVLVDDLSLSASGLGGNGDNGNGGAGTGGSVIASANNASLTVNFFTALDANGEGGTSNAVGGTGGLGTGGETELLASNGGTVTLGSVNLLATGIGGFAQNGTGGDGIGNLAHIGVNGGDITINGSAFVDASGFGGNGINGGDGTGGGNFFTATDGAHIRAQNGDISMGSAFVRSDGQGGIGSSGGDGGDGTGGWATIHAGNSNAGPSLITIQGVESSAFVSASGNGGHGGDGIPGIDGQPGGTGTNGDPGTDGGDGGAGTGGVAAITAGAGNGALDLGFASAFAWGVGGNGGDGGNGGIGGDGDGGAGGNGGAGGLGGAGGAAVGGLVTVGAVSGVAAALTDNLGSADFGFVELDGSAFGGDGGAGGLGGAAGLGSPNGIAGADGNGGSGGFANGGTTNLMAQGGLVDVSSVILTANATGGDGGSGAVAGIGGDAESDEVGVIVTDRFGDGTQRGELIAGSITGTVIADGGSGLSAGVGSAEGGSSFIVENGDATIGSVNIFGAADQLIPDLATDMIAVVNGTVTIDGDFSFTMPGQVSVYADNGSLIAGTVTIGASNFVHDPERTFPASIGSLNADTFDLSTGGDLIIDAHLISTASLNISAPGLIDIEDATSGSDLTLDAVGSISGGSMTAAGLIDAVAGGDIGLNLVIAGTDITMLSTAGSIFSNGLSAGGLVDLHAGADVSTGDITSGSSINVLADNGGIGVGDLLAPTSVDLTAPGAITISGIVDAGTDINISSTIGAITAGNMSAGGDINASSGGDMNLADLMAGSDILLDSGSSIGTGSVDANSVTMSAGTNITTGDIFAFGAVDLDALGTILTGDIIANSIDLFAGGDITTGDLTTQISDLLLGEGEIVALLFPGASITLESGGDISTGDISSRDGVYANAGGGIATGTIDAIDFVQLHAAGDIGTGDITAGQYLWVDSGGSQSLGDLSAGLDIELEAGGDAAFGNANAGTEFDFDVGGNVTGGNIVAGVEIGGEGAGGSVTLGDLTAGLGQGVPEDTFSIGFTAGGSITVGNVQGAQRVGFATLGDLTTGSIDTGWDFMALVGGDITTGAITTASDGEVYLANASMYLDATNGGELDFDPEIVLALNPVATGGSISIDGPVSTGQFRAAAGIDLAAGGITADTIEASAGGTATLNGLWSAQDVTLASNDIDITGTGGITGSGLVTLISTNATQALIGDGLTGTGYALSNAEFGRIEGGSVYILALGDASAAIDMLIGDLTVTGPSAGSTIEDSDGILVFATGDVASQTPGGIIRVVGDVTATGFGSGNAVEFHADRFELDAATGSISLTSSGGALAGELGLYANQIHVAEGAILDQLAVDPQYAGYQDDLNAPAAVQRPEGVLNASVIWIESDNLQDILIQNTGTEETPAGFLANEVFVNEDFDVAGPPGSIDVVVNGQLITEAGTLTGVDVRDALVEGEDLSPFTGNSTINGCLLTGPCGVTEGPFPPGFTPTPGIQDEFELFNNNQLPPPEFGNEDFIDDNDETTLDSATSPIKPPHPLFDTSALGGKGDVDDPVSGSGNPSLMETPPPPPSNQEKQP